MTSTTCTDRTGAPPGFTAANSLAHKPLRRWLSVPVGGAGDIVAV